MHHFRSVTHVWLFVGSLLLLLLTAGQCGGEINSRPVANAGSDQNVTVGDTVNLNGSASTDPDGDALTFNWSLESVPVGSAAALASANTSSPTFTTDVEGEYVVTLTVSDGVLDASDSVSVIASAANATPVISPIEDQAVFAGEGIDVPFTFTDENPDGVSVEATSNDQTLVADSDIQVLGSGADRTLRITSALLGEGSVVITVVVRDSGGLEDAESFGLVVTQPFVRQLKLTANDAASGDEFGRSVAISGDHAIVGAPLDAGGGSAYVFDRSGGDWVQSMKLPPVRLGGASAVNTVSPGDEFGVSVAISGDYAIVGSWLDDDGGFDSGAAYVYERCDSTLAVCDQPWHEVGKLIASDAADADLFGGSVAISGDYAVVGAFQDSLVGTNEGSAYVFKRSGEDWNEIGKLTASDGADFDFFGVSVSIDGDFAIVGAFQDSLAGTDEGSAYVFKRSGDNWIEVDKLIASDAADNDYFGLSVAISGDYTIIGASRDDLTGGRNEGSAYVFKRSGEDWNQIDKLTASDAAADDFFGTSVAISGDYAIVGAQFDDLVGESQGSAYVFQPSGDNWIEVDKLTASDAADVDLFGRSVAINGDYAMIGAPFDDHDGTNEGSAYVFER